MELQGFGTLVDGRGRLLMLLLPNSHGPRGGRAAARWGRGTDSGPQCERSNRRGGLGSMVRHRALGTLCALRMPVGCLGYGL